MSYRSDGTEPIRKVSIIVSKGSLEGIYPALIMANGARAEACCSTPVPRTALPPDCSKLRMAM